MISKWYDKKADAHRLRQNGVSLRTIEKSLGVPRSTLSGWFKEIKLSEAQKAKLTDKQQQSLARARVKAADWHRQQRSARLSEAEIGADATFDRIELGSAASELALAMFYKGSRKAGSQTAAFSSSDPATLKFILAALESSYGLARARLGFVLYLRADQDIQEQKLYWSEQLAIPVENFKYVSLDKRTAGKTSFKSYHGVCVFKCGMAIQRRLIYLYNLFSQEVISEAGV
jgi:hypothetical protein